MEGIDIDSIVRKAVTEYRKQEREPDALIGMGDRSRFYLEDIGLQRNVEVLQRRVEVMERQLLRIDEVQKRLWALEDAMQNLGRPR